MLPDSAREVVTSGRLAHLTTVNADGSPHLTITWVGLDAEELVMATLLDQRKLRNMRRDPGVAISIATDRMNEHGLTEYLVAYGRATVTEGGAPELLQELAYTYIGPGVKFPPFPDPPPGYVTRIAIERLGGIGPWAQR
jgi:PPOX class probable F420-dependent enzyme